MLLEQIQQTNDIKKINPKDYPLLAEEIRQFLIEKISVTGGHLGSNLGAVELTMAMHIALNLPEDKIVWDVGHQSYTHKLLTGRREGFDHLRKYGGMSGFPKRKESDCDSFDFCRTGTCARKRYSGQNQYRCFRDRRRCADRRNGIRSAEQCGEDGDELYHYFK